MSPYGPDPRAAQAIAQRSGCAIVRSTMLDDGSFAHEIDCPTHAAKVELLANLAEFDARTPAVRRRAEQIVAGASSAGAQLARLLGYVQRKVVFTREPRETFTTTMRTLDHGLGDCDDSARAMMALARSLGHNAALRVLPALSTGKAPVHVAAAAKLGGRWRWMEASIPAHLGEHPIAAAKRLGITTRADIGLGGLNPDDDDAATYGFTPEQWIGFGAGAAGAIAAILWPKARPLVLAATGAASAYTFTSWPLLGDFQLTDGHGCTSWLPGVSSGGRGPECEARYNKIKQRNAAIGAVAGLAAGLLLR